MMGSLWGGRLAPPSFPQGGRGLLPLLAWPGVAPTSLPEEGNENAASGQPRPRSSLRGSFLLTWAPPSWWAGPRHPSQSAPAERARLNRRSWVSPSPPPRSDWAVLKDARDGRRRSGEKGRGEEGENAPPTGQGEKAVVPVRRRACVVGKL